jgi:hypothetical protein
LIALTKCLLPEECVQGHVRFAMFLPGYVLMWWPAPLHVSSDFVLSTLLPLWTLRHTRLGVRCCSVQWRSVTARLRDADSQCWLTQRNTRQISTAALKRSNRMQLPHSFPHWQARTVCVWPIRLFGVFVGV